MAKIPDTPIGAVLRTVGNTGNPTQNGLLPTVPPSLLNVPAGTLVNAVVTGSGQDGSLVLRTPNGLLSIQTILPLQPGNTLEFQVVNPGKDLQLLLLSVDTEPVATNPSQKNVANDKATLRNPTPDGLLFTVLPKTKQTPTTQQQALPSIQATLSPAVKTETPRFQPGQVVQATLTNIIREEAVESLLQPFTFNPTQGKFLPSIASQPAQGEAPPITPGASFSFRVVNVIPAVTIGASPPPLQTTTALSPVAPALPNGTDIAGNQVAAPLIPTPTGSAPTLAPITITATPLATPQTNITPVTTPSSQNITETIPNQAVQGAAVEEEALPTNTFTPPRPITPPVTPGLPTNIAPQSTVNTGTTTPAVINGSSGAPLVEATVISSVPAGDTILRTPLGTFRTQLPTTLPKQAVLQLELTAIVPVQVLQPGVTTVPSAEIKTDGLSQLLQHWASLDDAVKTVQQTNIPSVADKLLEAIPNPNNNLGVKLLHFIQALRSGVVSDWLGQEFIRSLQQEKKTELLGQLSREFNVMRNVFTQPPSNTWQTLIFPVFSEGMLHQARMYIRSLRDQEKENRQGRGKPTDARFVVEVELEKLGPMQFDGLVRQVDDGKFFDLVIRSHSLLDAGIMDDIRAIFVTTQEVTGLKGKVSFENTKVFPVNPASEVLVGETGKSIIV